jgi:hypothetical protein
MIRARETVRARLTSAASVVGAVAVLVGCGGGGPSSPATSQPTSPPASSSSLVSDAIGGLPLTPERQRTLGSLQKLDEHPLYYMEYSGDYDDLMRFIPQTDVGSSAALRPELQACSLFAAMGDLRHAIHGRNRGMSSDTLASMVLFAHPSDGQASVAMVDLTTLGYSGGPPDMRLLAAPLLSRDGMNASGVTVSKADVPLISTPRYDPARPTINFMTAMRFVLDHAHSTEEAIELLDRYNVAFWSGGHFLIADAAGHSAVVEFGPGRLYVLRNDRPWQVATNFLLYAFAGGASPCWRYDRLQATLSASSGVQSREEAMESLASVSVAGRTLWSAVYDMSGREMDLAMARHYERIFRFRLGVEASSSRSAPEARPAS